MARHASPRTWALLAWAVVAATIGACEPRAPTNDGRTTETTSAELDSADADPRTPEGFLRVKKAYRAAMTAKVAEADRRLDDLRSRAAKVDDASRRAQLQAAVRDARTQRELFRLDVRSLDYASQSTWGEDRAAMDQKGSALQTTIDRIEQQVVTKQVCGCRAGEGRKSRRSFQSKTHSIKNATSPTVTSAATTPAAVSSIAP